VYEYAFGQFNIGAGSAAAMVLFGILLVFMVVYFRWIMREGRME
jgi:ABC-type sugar transport system permease subunit